MRGLCAVFVVAVLAVAGSGCTCFSGFTSCVGARCPSSCSAGGCGIGPLSCGPVTQSSCSDCGTDPCACDTAAPIRCPTPAFAFCKPDLFRALFGCTGCDGEYYWSEWFSDPPNCCDPCDEYGNWTGPGHGQPAEFVPTYYHAPPAGLATGAGGCPCGRH